MDRLEKGSLRLDVTGTKYDIAEIAEQLAWLGSALRVPDQRGQICICHAELSSVPLEREETLDETSFRMQFHQSPLTLDKGVLASGQCWRGFFQRLTIARGYPVPSRPKEFHGLDIPIGVAAQIIGGKQINLSDSRLLIKGFGTALFPSKVDYDGMGKARAIAWHFLENQFGLRISYADVSRDAYDSVDRLRSEHLRTAQNIVGWCEIVKNVTGM